MADNGNFSLQIEKQKEILDYVNENKKASVKELSESTGLSEVTIRKYLLMLANKGLLIKTHGGVISKKSALNYEVPYSEKETVNTEEKERIGAAAAKLIADGDVILIDSGSTTLQIARAIKNQDITVITNDIKIAYELSPKSNVKLFVTGGMLRNNVFTLVGSDAESYLRRLHVNKTFLGADAIHLDSHVTNNAMEDAEIKKLMIQAAEQVILVSDHSKFNKKCFLDICSFNDIDIVITDQITPEYRKAFTQSNIKVIVV
jgi:DeoR/GlpR family transcriptional regulator of sugar metabolism